MAFEGQCGNCKDFKDKDNDNKPFDTKWAKYEKGHCVRYGCFYWADDTCSKQNDRDKPDYGFNPCYITTVVCNILGYNDDCGVLQSLRNLRDNVMQKDEKYAKTLYEYDTVGPKIASKLQEDKDIELATALYNFYLVPTALLVNEEKYDEAVHRYQEMTTGLKDAFGIDETVMPQNYDVKKGGHGLVYTK